MSIAVKNISYAYPAAGGKTVSALQHVSFSIEEGEFVGVMGHTGCGKTTLLQILAGLLKPSEGQVLLSGTDINAPGYDRKLLRQRVGLVFQYPEYQLFETTVEKDVAFGLKHSGLSRDQVTARVRQALEAVGFTPSAVMGQSPLALSGGEKRRVAIAGVLAARPSLLLFDEPVAGLDPLGRETFLHMTEKLNREGVTVVMVSHNADALSQCARRLLVLREGKLELDRPAAQAFADGAAMRRLGLDTSWAGEMACRLSQRGIPLPGVASYSDLLTGLKERFGREASL